MRNLAIALSISILQISSAYAGMKFHNNTNKKITFALICEADGQRKNPPAFLVLEPNQRKEQSGRGCNRIILSYAQQFRGQSLTQVHEIDPAVFRPWIFEVQSSSAGSMIVLKNAFTKKLAPSIGHTLKKNPSVNDDSRYSLKDSSPTYVKPSSVFKGRKL